MMADKLEATITIREVKQRKSDFVKLTDNSGKTFNCSEMKYLRNATDGRPIFVEGRKLDIVYHEYQGEHNGKSYVSKYIDECRPSEAPNTWPDKEPFQGGGKSYSGNGGGNSKPKGDFRTPDQIMRGNAVYDACVRLQGVDGLSAKDVLAEANEYYQWMKGDLANLVEQAVTVFEAKPDPDEDIPFDRSW
jgi:hypothetical protein